MSELVFMLVGFLAGVCLCWALDKSDGRSRGTETSRRRVSVPRGLPRTARLVPPPSLSGDEPARSRPQFRKCCWCDNAASWDVVIHGDRFPVCQWHRERRARRLGA